MAPIGLGLGLQGCSNFSKCAVIEATYTDPRGLIDVWNILEIYLISRVCHRGHVWVPACRREVREHRTSRSGSNASQTVQTSGALRALDSRLTKRLDELSVGLLALTSLDSRATTLPENCNACFNQERCFYYITHTCLPFLTTRSPPQIRWRQPNPSSTQPHPT
jgi:hypothetical protein